jgi:hypothetical protein
MADGNRESYGEVTLGGVMAVYRNLRENYEYRLRNNKRNPWNVDRIGRVLLIHTCI